MALWNAVANTVARLSDALEPWGRSTRFASWVPMLRHPTLDREVVGQLAEAFLVTLPEDYSDFLTTVGNGGFGPTHYPLYSLAFALFESPMCAGRFELSRPMMFVETSMVQAASDHLVHNHGLDLQGCVLNDRAANRPEMSGGLFIGESGCGLDYYLVVDPSSSRTGEVWLSCDQGIFPVSKFREWYEAGLVRAEEAGKRAKAAVEPNSDVVIESACLALDRWVGLVQKYTDRALASRGVWTGPAAREVRHEAMVGPLKWEGAYAMACYDACEELVGDNRKLLTHMAWAEGLLDIGDAEARLSRLKRLDAESGFLFADRAAARGAVDKAILRARETLRSHPESHATLNALATYLARAGEHVEARAIHDRLSKLEASDWESDYCWTYSERPQGWEYLFVGRAIAALSSGDRARAIAWLERAIEEGLPRWVIAANTALEPIKGMAGYVALMSR